MTTRPLGLRRHTITPAATIQGDQPVPYGMHRGLPRRRLWRDVPNPIIEIELTLSEAADISRWPSWRQAISLRLRIHVLARDARGAGFPDVAEFLEKAESKGQLASLFMLVLMGVIRAKNVIRMRMM